mgnify:CR=1 FL=1
MTLLRMATDYRQSGDLIRLRIAALKDAQQQTDDMEEKRRYEGRIRELSALYRETREVAIMLERYYDRRYHRSERYSI